MRKLVALICLTISIILASCTNSEDSVSEAFEKGYDLGHHEGHGSGYREGLIAGEKDGYGEGYRDGYSEGYDDCVAEYGLNGTGETQGYGKIEKDK